VFLFFYTGISAQNLVANGKVTFTSKAPQETITARSNRLTGLLNPADQTFAFIVDINTFDGFNSPMQKVHFNENYMETTKYPKSRFYGRIIENIDFDKVQQEVIRAKGYLEIHGIRKTRIIQVNLIRKNGVLFYSSKFNLSLWDYEITIPRIVHQKLSDLIEVHVEGTIQKQNP
jgi:hypothetical protein